MISRELNNTSRQEFPSDRSGRQCLEILIQGQVLKILIQLSPRSASLLILEDCSTRMEKMQK